MPFDPDTVRIELNSRHRPERLILAHDGFPDRDFDALGWLEADHLAFFVEAFCGRTKVPAKLLWNAAAFRIMFLAQTLERCPDTTEEAQNRAGMLLAAMFAPADHAPQTRLARPVTFGPDGIMHRRAVCCLNDRLGNGRERCAICPAQATASGSLREDRRLKPTPVATNIRSAGNRQHRSCNQADDRSPTIEVRA